MKKRTKRSIKKVKFVFDGWLLEINVGESKKMSFMGIPIGFWEEKGVVYVDFNTWLIQMADRIRTNQLN